MNTKKIVVAVALALATSAAFSQECGGPVNPCPSGDAAAASSGDLLNKAKGFFSGALKSASDLANKGAEALKDKHSVWPDGVESAGVQLFPAYANSVTCVRRDQEAMGIPRDEQAKFCAEKLRNINYHFATFATLYGKTDGELEPMTSLSSRYIYRNTSVVAMPRYANSVTCYADDISGDGVRECQVLRPVLRELPGLKYISIPTRGASRL